MVHLSKVHLFWPTFIGSCLYEVYFSDPKTQLQMGELLASNGTSDPTKHGN